MKQSKRSMQVRQSKINAENFMKKFGEEHEDALDADQRVIKLINKLLLIYHDVFETEHYDEIKQELKSTPEAKEFKSKIVERLVDLRKKVQNKISSANVIFENIFDS